MHFKKNLLRVNFILTFYVLVSASPAWSEDIEDLKGQIKLLQSQLDILNTKVAELEEQQTVQSAELKKIPALESKVDKAPRQHPEFFNNAKVGGHLELFLFDQSRGERNDEKQSNRLSAGINSLYLYFSKELSEWLGLEVATDTAVSAGATPSLGSDITRATSGSVDTSLHSAFITARLPKEVEARIGLFNPLFSEDYAKETWWDQLYHSNKGLDYLQSWHDSGLEIYKNFDFDEFSLPVYLYYLNGNTAYNGQFVDNNNAKTVLLHIAPEFFQTKLKLLGSVAAGKWDNDSNKDIVRYATGFEWKYKKLSFMTEYLYTKWEKRALTLGGVADAKQEGYQCKLLYRLTPQWRGVS